MGRVEKVNAHADRFVRHCARDGNLMECHLEGEQIVYRCPACWRTERSTQSDGGREIDPAFVFDRRIHKWPLE